MSLDPAQQCLFDCSTLGATELRHRYPAEENSHRNMLHRQKQQGRVVNPAFHEFRDFLRHVGPHPCRAATLDRKDNADPEYAPGKVRWADKRTQNNNKGDTLLFYYSRTGETYTVSRLAKLHNVCPSTIRKQKERGRTDDEIIEGKRAPAFGCVPPSPKAAKATSTSTMSSISRRAPQISDAERRFRANAAEAERHRREHGEEYCLSPLWMLNELAAGCSVPVPLVSQDDYDWKFEHWWDDWWPHVFLDKLPEEAQETLTRLKDRIGPFKRRHSREAETDIASLYKQFVAINWEPKSLYRNVSRRALPNRPRAVTEDTKGHSPPTDTRATAGVVQQAQGDTNGPIQEAPSAVGPKTITREGNTPAMQLCAEKCDI
jgi:hypothetical protein